MVFYNIDAKSKDANKSRLKANMIRDRPGAIGFTRGFSQDSISITVGEQITVEQLIEKCIVMRLSRQPLAFIYALFIFLQTYPTTPTKVLLVSYLF